MTAFHHRLKLLTAFLVGAVVTALLCNVTWLQRSYCIGNGCTTMVTGTEPHFIKLLSIFAASTRNGSNQLSVRETGRDVNVAVINRSRSTVSSMSKDMEKERRVQSSLAGLEVGSDERPSYKSPQPPARLDLQFPFPTRSLGRSTHSTPDVLDSQPMSSRISSQCSAQYCQDLLSSSEKTHLMECYKKCDQHRSKFGPVINGTCRFVDGNNRLPVALASFPGSGNTWARGLIEKVTGICTGGLYCDCGLRSNGLTGEGVKGAGVIVMKTHNKQPQFVGGHVISKTRLPYGSAILLVRNPRDALIAEWNREKSKKQVSKNVSNHFSYVGQEFFGANKDWIAYIHRKIGRWPQQIVFLLAEAKVAQCPVLILRYEDLKKHSVPEMKRVTDFLGFSFTKKEVSARLRGGYPQFYRNHTVDFQHFTPAEEQFLHSLIHNTTLLMKEYGVYSMFPHIDQYL